MSSIAFFNNKGGVGKTTLLYHLAHMYAELGVRVVAADLDPQSNLSSMFLEPDRLDEIWNGEEDRETITAAIRPLMQGTGDIVEPHLETITPNLSLIVGNLALSRDEDEFSSQWPGCLDGKERSFRVIAAMARVLDAAAKSFRANLTLIDVGPNLGAINRSALIAADFVVVPLVPDLFSLQGLRNLGPTLRDWRKGWVTRRQSSVERGLRNVPLPSGGMRPVGYVVTQHAVRVSRPTKAYESWLRRIPSEYRRSVLGQTELLASEPDPNCLAILKHYRSLMPLAMEARKPIFHLKPVDGAIGAHVAAVTDCHRDFEKLARAIARESGLFPALPA
jgi:cellulose biosynthesis protein BcsQ